MFISKKKYSDLVKRIEALERKTEVHTWDFGKVDLEGLCKKLPRYIDKKIAADKCESSAADKI